ncbi:MFS transporter [Burkholderia sp. FERM BP-3421]|jgi:MFS family permease|uniref:MFS transporter n=1 Tax=Burkholderia sp. FERM BP-3421 TaxID=1494466 RepID=UPI002361333F|nr:MFS transporter [Burkholderia sp. FERM BP-3421]WDD93618.1 MFS transporter [Burkholderia sp. FERM BP-3421]
MSQSELHSNRGPANLLLLTACMTAVLIPLSIAGPVVTVPSINRLLGGTAVELNWVSNAYLLTYGSATMAAGSLADVYGRKLLWLLGMLAYVLVTAAIPFAPSVLALDVLRLVQGLGAAAAFAGAMATLAQEFHGRDRTKVFSMIGTTFGLGAAFGPLVAGFLVDTLGWQWVFWLPALLGVLVVLFVQVAARESRDPNAAGLDWPGAISFTTTLGLFTYAILLVPENGWGSRVVIGALLVSAVLLAIFIVIETRVRRPMLDLSLFRSARFIGVQVLAAAPAYTYVVLILLLPTRLMGIDGQSAFEAGRFMIALSAPLLVLPFVAAYLARWFTAGVISGVGLLIAAVGLGWLGVAMASGTLANAVAPLVVIGVGIGLPWGLMDGMAVSVVEKERAGMATGIFNAVRLAADGVAIAVVGAILSARIFDTLGRGAIAGAQPEVLKEAANRLAISDVAHATSLLPGATRSLLLQAYNGAFEFQFYLLAAAAVVTAFVVFAALGSVRTHEEADVSLPDASLSKDAG